MRLRSDGTANSGKGQTHGRLCDWISDRNEETKLQASAEGVQAKGEHYPANDESDWNCDDRNLEEVSGRTQKVVARFGFVERNRREGKDETDEGWH